MIPTPISTNPAPMAMKTRTSYLLSCILPPVLLRFKKYYPDITLDIVETGAYELRELLKEQKPDMMLLSRIDKDGYNRSTFKESKDSLKVLRL